MPQITPSPELVSIIERWMDAMSSKHGPAFANLLSASPYMKYVGSAEGEVWSGASVQQEFRNHAAEIPDLTATNTSIEAFQHGDTGWGLWFGVLQANASEVSAYFRVSFVFALEDAVWKIVQMHTSNPVSNLETFGHEHVALDQLLNAAREVAPQVGQSGIASVMFTDIANSSAIASAVGDAAWSSAIHSHLAMVRSDIEQNNGILVKSLGDGTMSTFSSARAAMSAAKAVQVNLSRARQEPELQVRIGIHTGDVVQADGDFFGTVVNKAARVAGAAGPGEIRVSEATKIMVGGASEFSFRDAAKITLKGLEGEHRIYRLDWAPAA